MDLLYPDGDSFSLAEETSIVRARGEFCSSYLSRFCVPLPRAFASAALDERETLRVLDGLCRNNRVVQSIVETKNVHPKNNGPTLFRRETE